MFQTLAEFSERATTTQPHLSKQLYNGYVWSWNELDVLILSLPLNLGSKGDLSCVCVETANT